MNFNMNMSTQNIFRTAKWAFSTRRVDRSDAYTIHENCDQARPGDLILGRVSSIGQHRNIQLTQGRPSALFVGDIVVLACGARYAPDQFEGVAVINPKGADMLAGGGCIGKMIARNERIKPATRILPLGQIVNSNGVAINLADYSIPAAEKITQIPIIAVLGTSMNSGKTLATTMLSYGLRQSGLKVAAIKGTGTGAYGDYNKYVDAGIHYVADFTDAGMVTTYKEPLTRIKTAINNLTADAEASGAEIIVMEIADGIFQRETAALLADAEFRASLSGVVFACGDAVAAAGGVAELARHGIKPVALTGMLSCSPMTSREAEQATGIQVLTKSGLADPSNATWLRNISKTGNPSLAAA